MAKSLRYAFSLLLYRNAFYVHDRMQAASDMNRNAMPYRVEGNIVAREHLMSNIPITRYKRLSVNVMCIPGIVLSYIDDPATTARLSRPKRLFCKSAKPVSQDNKGEYNTPKTESTLNHRLYVLEEPVHKLSGMRYNNGISSRRRVGVERAEAEAVGIS